MSSACTFGSQAPIDPDQSPIGGNQWRRGTKFCAPTTPPMGARPEYLFPHFFANLAIDLAFFNGSAFFVFLFTVSQGKRNLNKIPKSIYFNWH